MAENNNKRSLKITFLLSALTAVIVFLLCMNLLKYANKENPAYIKWQMLSEKAKDLKTEDGQLIYPMPEKQIPLKQTEITILSAGVAFFTPLSVFPICYSIFRRRSMK